MGGEVLGYQGDHGPQDPSLVAFGQAILVVSGDIYGSVARHGYEGIDHKTFHQLVRVQVADRRYAGGFPVTSWVRALTGEAGR